MRDLWAFLLQTLTVSGAAVLLLIVKALFRDKLSPRWQFSAWGVLGILLLVPAGLSSRYVLFNWPYVVETVKTWLTGEYSLTRVTAPIPLLMNHTPTGLWDWLFLVYAAGAAILLLTHAVSYLRLRAVLRKGTPADETTEARLRGIAERYDLAVCPAVVVPGLTSAFVCGLFHPVLALPQGVETDDKVLLHELLHLNHHDTVWSVVLCLVRCTHWCNPLLWYCANQAGNDLESLCDQRVLERIEGEERRDYGRILLSMANEQYARATGTSSMANGGRNIRQRIEAIVRFKQYPAGMRLVSACVLLVLLVPLLLGTGVAGVSNHLSSASFVASGGELSDREMDLRLTEARTLRCTTAAGALDTYAKALLTENGFYRAMCLPMAEQAGFAAKLKEQHVPTWDMGLDVQPWEQAEYAVYNLEHVGENAYEGLVVVRQWLEIEELPEELHDPIKVGVQLVRTELEGNRWVVSPLEPIHSELVEGDGLIRGTFELPACRYVGIAEDFQVEVLLQRTYVVDNTIVEDHDMSWFMGPSTRFDLVPKPHAAFSEVHRNQREQGTYLGSTPETITQMGLSVIPVYPGEERPQLQSPVGDYASGSSSNDEDWVSRPLDPGWGPVVHLGGGGSGGTYDEEESFMLPEYYAADLYLNHEKAAEMTLKREEGSWR